MKLDDTRTYHELYHMAGILYATTDKRGPKPLEQTDKLMS